jgi:hypothetical protein
MYALAVCTILFIGMLIGINIEKKNHIQTDLHTLPKIELYDSVSTSFMRLNVQYSDSVFDIVLAKTDSLNSEISIDNNNLFMMKPENNRRISTAIGIRHGYLVYNSWRESVIDWVIYTHLKEHEIHNKIQTTKNK